jgi:putative transposase
MITLLLHAILAALKTRHQLAMENLALRHQVQVLRRSGKRPRLTRADRGFWVLLSRIWRDWRNGLVIVKPDTVVRWHRTGFKLYWRWKSRRRKRGRPHVSLEVMALVRKISLTNPLWGAPRIHGELLKLGIDLAQSTISKYMAHPRRPPSQTWKTFLRNHLGETASIDFFTVPTATFRVLYVFLVLSHNRRRVIHFNVTEFPSAKWTARQLIETFPWDTAPEFLLRDRDSIYGHEVVRTIHNLCAEQILTAPRSPWQNPYVERVIGSIRRECLDHMIVVNENHLRKVLNEYFRYYTESRTHLALGKDCPEPREIEPPEMGEIVAVPHVGGLHHRYTRIAA